MFLRNSMFDATFSFNSKQLYCLACRFLLLRDRLLSYESKDIASGSPAQSHWAPLRKSLHCALRLFGDGREQTDALLDIACQELVSEVLAHDGQAFDLHSIVYKFTMKSLFILLCGSVCLCTLQLMVTFKCKICLCYQPMGYIMKIL